MSSTERARHGLQNFGNTTSDINRTMDRASFSIKGFIGSILGISAVVGVINTVRNAIDGAVSRYDTLGTFPTVMKQMGFSAEESEKAINKLSDGIQGLPTTLDDVASTAQQIATMTNDLEGATDTTLALNNAFITSGSSSADASRGLNQYVQMLSKGEVDLQSWRTLQETMGVALNDTAKAFGFAGTSAQNDLYAALQSGEITFQDFNDKIIELNEGVNGFAERAKTSTSGIRTAWTNMQTAVVRGVTNIITAIDEVLKNTPLKSIENIITTTGKAFFSFLDSFAKGISTVLPVVIGYFQTLFSLLQPYIPILKQIAMGIAVFIATFAGLNTLKNIILGVRTAMVLLNTAILMNPIAWLAALVIGAVAAFIYFWKNSEIFRDKVTSAFQTLKTIAMQVFSVVASFIGEKIDQIKQFWDENGTQFVEAVKNAFKMILSVVEFIMPAVLFVVEMVWTAIKQVIDGALNIIMGLIKIFSGLFTGDWSKMWEGIKQLFFGAIDLIIGLFSLSFVGGLRKLLVSLGKSALSLVKSMWSGIVNFFKSFGSTASSIASKMSKSIVDYFKSLYDRAISIWSTLRTFGASIWNALKETVVGVAKTIFSTVKGRFQDKFNAVKTTMTNLKTKVSDIWGEVVKFFKNIDLYKIGKDIIQGLINGVGAMSSAVWDKAKSIANGIGDSIRGALDIHSPSRVAISLMEFFGQGMVKGLDNSVSWVKKASQSLGNAVVPDVPRFNLAGEVAGINKMAESKIYSDVQSAVAVSKEPANINIRIGQSEFNAFVDDISNAQNRKAFRTNKRPR
ncbi:phage tail protein [Cytobacillus kochii]|uniref:phage tail protein n=1 Tax=Cytobacillus kochii TaxID=859143 RepID=UPI003F818002